MTHEDELAFVEAMARTRKLSIGLRLFDKKREMPIKSLKAVGSLPYDDRLFLFRRRDKPRLDIDHFPESPFYVLDQATSDAVEFTRCRMIDGWLAKGRLWFDEKRSAKKKPEHFLAWAAETITWIKMMYLKGENGIYVGPDAVRASREGLHLGAR